MTQHLQFSVEDIDPHTAKDLLGGNTHNRNLRGRVVDSYAADMRAGAWQQNGESIKIAEDGTIVDGQHRLHAIVESGVTVPMFVVRGLPMEAQDVIDTGAKRTFADALKLRKETNYNMLAAVTRRVDLWQRGVRTTKSNFVPTNTQLLATLERHPDIRVAAEAAVSIRHHIPIQGSVVGICYWLFSNLEVKDQEEAARLAEDVPFFFERLSDGAELATNHPIYVLRRTAIENMTSKSRINEIVMTAYVIKAWNAYRDGRKMGLLRFRPGGANPESFPEPE